MILDKCWRIIANLRIDPRVSLVHDHYADWDGLARQLHGMGGFGTMALALAERPEMPARLFALSFQRVPTTSGRPVSRDPAKAPARCPFDSARSD
jgi:hypothetical protein